MDSSEARCLILFLNIFKRPRTPPLVLLAVVDAEDDVEDDVDENASV